MLIFSLQEEFLSSELLQLVERCRMMKSNVNILTDLKTVPGNMYLLIHV